MKIDSGALLQNKRWKFQLVKESIDWQREYSGVIQPLSQYRFLLRCDRLTGRTGVKRSSRYATHLILGVWWDGLHEVSLPPREFWRLKDKEAFLIQDFFAKWWIAAIERYRTTDVLRWNSDPLFFLSS